MFHIRNGQQNQNHYQIFIHSVSFKHWFSFSNRVQLALPLENWRITVLQLALLELVLVHCGKVLEGQALKKYSFEIDTFERSTGNYSFSRAICGNLIATIYRHVFKKS